MAKTTPDKGLQQLKNDLSSGEIGQVYIFHGEESYLREYYLGELKKALVPAGFEEFNYHRLDGKNVTIPEISEVVEAMPMMSERTMVVLTDCDIFKLDESSRELFISMLEDFPEYCCLVLAYDVLEYKRDARLKKLCTAIDKHALTVNFQIQEKSDLINWIRRRFHALGKDIDARTAEHLIFTCGGLMTGLVPEIEKIGAYARGKSVTIEDINEIADPVLDAVVFNMTNAITRGDYNSASETLGQLLKQQEEPIMILAVVSKELHRLYTARIALDEGKDKLWLMEQWGMRSDYPARLLLDAARRTTPEWCANCVSLCQKLDRRFKSENKVDYEGEIKLLLMELAQKK